MVDDNLIETKKGLKLFLEEGKKKLQYIEELEKQQKERDSVVLKVGKEIAKTKHSFLDDKKLIEFFGKPYVVIPHTKNSVFVAVPKFIKDFQVGWLHKETETFYIYEFDQYSAWLSDAPQDLLDELDISKKFELEINGDEISFNITDRDEIKKKLHNHLSRIGDTTAKITRGHVFDVLVETIKAGHIPYKMKKVSESDLREQKSNIKLRPYQKKAVDKFMETGAVGVFHPTGAGKTFVSLYLLDVIKGQKRVIVPTRTLVEQWEMHIQNFLPHCKDEITISTYQGAKAEGSYALTIFDECQRLPANSFSKLALIDTKYRVGLSASPHREDGRESYIFALTGFPVGLNWQEYMKDVNRKYHPVHVHRINNKHSKVAYIKKLIDFDKKTIIFVDSIPLGKEISKKYKIPHIFGETKNRLEEIENNKVMVMSRVGDLGVSVPDLQRIIEVDFLFGSRQQELQRTGRLMHSQKPEKHEIIMTVHEWKQYGKRLWALQEKGFQVKLVC